MTLSEVYFYMLVIMFLIFSLLIVFFSEDLKHRKYLILFLKITFAIGWIGVIMQVFGWNYLCKTQLILISFSPFITVLIIKSFTKLLKSLFKIEPFNVSLKKEPLNGIWTKNNWDNKNYNYHLRYSNMIFVFPALTIATIYGIIERSFC